MDKYFNITCHYNFMFLQKKYIKTFKENLTIVTKKYFPTYFYNNIIHELFNDNDIFLINFMTKKYMINKDIVIKYAIKYDNKQVLCFLKKIFDEKNYQIAFIKYSMKFNKINYDIIQQQILINPLKILTFAIKYDNKKLYESCLQLIYENQIIIDNMYFAMIALMKKKYDIYNIFINKTKIIDISWFAVTISSLGCVMLLDDVIKNVVKNTYVDYSWALNVSAHKGHVDVVKYLYELTTKNKIKIYYTEIIKNTLDKRNTEMIKCLIECALKNNEIINEVLQDKIILYNPSLT